MAENESPNKVPCLRVKVGTLVWKLLQAGPAPLVISSVPKQTLNRYLKEFEAKGWIKREVNSRPIIWALTGQSPTFVIGYDKCLLMRFHHAQIRFRVLSWGTYPLTCQKTLLHAIKNNQYFDRKCRGVLMRFFPDSIIVFCPDIYANHEAQAYAKATFQVMNIMQDLANRYDLQLGPPEFCRRPHIAIINNEFTESLTKWCKVKGIYPNFGDFWVDESTGDGEFETSQLFKAQQVINGFSKLPTLFEQLNPVLEGLATQIKLHLAVMQEIKDGLKQQTAIFEQIKGLVEHLTNKGEAK